MTVGDDTGPVRASDDPWNKGQVAGDAATDDPQRHEHRLSEQTVDSDAVVMTWLAEDPDEDTQAELKALLAAGDAAEIGRRFGGTLAFGTAGLRAALGAGPMRMNRVVVQRAAAGLVAYLKLRGGTSVVIGYDARHKSDVFARDTADLVAGAGLTAWVLPRPLPTPVLAYAIRAVGADAGVMVTASHNPAQDNGYKVYLGDGSQIVPPADAEIAASIDAVGPLVMLPRSSEWTTLGEEMVRGYLERAAAVALPGTPRALDIVHTPLHGVGGTLVVEALTRAGFAAPYVVPEQAEPDPDFPTAPFPNPEEPGAMDLALAAARGRSADIVLATDPDADRCAVGVPDQGGWRMLTGDEVGALLGAALIARGEKGTYAASIVSSALLGRIAAAAGEPYVETLTGFKWIGRVPGLRFGYEEALGYCVDPTAVADKDGIATVVLVAALAAAVKADGRSLLDLLDDLHDRFGLHVTDQVSLRYGDPADMVAVMQRLRADPAPELGGQPVTSVDDLLAGDQPGGEAALPPTDGLRYRLADSTRVVVRPSGTEPKIKCYVEVVEPVAGDRTAARRRAAERISSLRADLTLLLGG